MGAATPTAVEIARYGELAVDIVYLRARGLLVAPFRGDYRIGQEIVDASELRARAASERARRAASAATPSKALGKNAPAPKPIPRGVPARIVDKKGLGPILTTAPPDERAMCPCGRPVRPSHGRCWAIRGLDGPPTKSRSPAAPSSDAAKVAPVVPKGNSGIAGERDPSPQKAARTEWTEVTRAHARVRDGTPLTVGVGRHYGLHIMAQASLLAELGWTAKETVRLFADVAAGRVMLRPDKTGHYNLSRQKLGGAICRFGKIPGLSVGSFAMTAASYRIDGNRLVIDLPEQITSHQQEASDASRT